jgi:hypothetical protein
MAQNLSLEWNGMCSNRHEYSPSRHAGTMPRRLVSHCRSSGQIIARATCSQFAIAGGQSACTSICLYAAARLLESIYETPTCITTDILDVFLHYGSMFFRRLDLHQETIQCRRPLEPPSLRRDRAAAPTRDCDSWDDVSIVVSRMPTESTMLC